MIICVGEILADMIGKTRDENFVYERFAGGAPFNVACCLKKLNVECGFYGVVGHDTIGTYLCNKANSLNFDYLNIRVDEERNTTLAFVEVDAHGERSFSFYRKNTADAYFDENDINKIVSEADIIHIGSLAMSVKSGRAFLDKLIECAKSHGKKISFDVNYRDDIFAYGAEAIRIYKEYIEKADIIKFSDNELPMFYSGTSVEEMLCKVQSDTKVILLTLGKRGSMACADGKIYYEPTIPTDKVIDTNGAGDSFMAGALSGIYEGNENWNHILRRANACGSLAVSQSGAFPEWGRDDVDVKLAESR